MPESPSPNTERRVQPRFRKFSLFSYLALFVVVLGIDRAWGLLPDRDPRPLAQVPVSFTPVALDRSGFAPLALAGAWEVSASDPRFGGISSLAVDGSRLVALTDSGVVIDLPRPGAGSLARLSDLPNGPVSPYFKKFRDSEALVRRSDGRGWWVAFENRHGLWSYDPTFRFLRSRRSLAGRDWRANRGVEAIVEGGDLLLLLPEEGDQLVRVKGESVASGPLDNDLGSPTDARTLPDGRILVTVRSIGLLGVRNRLAWLDERNRGDRLVSLADLPLGRFDNVEALAAEPRDDGSARLWLMTDNDFRRWRRTLLVAIDLPSSR